MWCHGCRCVHLLIFSCSYISDARCLNILGALEMLTGESASKIDETDGGPPNVQVGENTMVHCI